MLGSHMRQGHKAMPSTCSLDGRLLTIVGLVFFTRALDHYDSGTEQIHLFLPT